MINIKANFGGMRYFKLITFVALLVLSSCASSKKSNKVNVLSGNTHTETSAEPPVSSPKVSTTKKPMLTMDKPLDIDPEDFLSYAKKFLNVPYLYASSDPGKGFDCSGFLYYVFLHFNVQAPRSSYNYENVGKDISVEKAKEGDLILFTTQTNPNKIGHIGIVTDTAPKLSFIHASTSKGVIISQLSGYYQKHLVKVIRVLK